VKVNSREPDLDTGEDSFPKEVVFKVEELKDEKEIRTMGFRRQSGYK
jgi:hypothetical protein